MGINPDSFLGVLPELTGSLTDSPGVGAGPPIQVSAPWVQVLKVEDFRISSTLGPVSPHHVLPVCMTTGAWEQGDKGPLGTVCQA